MRVSTISEFIERAIKVHGDKYDYSKGIKLLRINYLGKKEIRAVLQKELL
jgi:hypothetical protein